MMLPGVTRLAVISIIPLADMARVGSHAVSLIEGGDSLLFNPPHGLTGLLQWVSGHLLADGFANKGPQYHLSVSNDVRIVQAI